MIQNTKRPKPYFSFLGVLLGAASIVSVLVGDGAPLTTYSEPLAAVACVLAYIGFLKDEHWALIFLALCLGGISLILTNWIILALLFIIPATPYFRLGGTADTASESIFGLIGAAVVLMVLPFFGISLLVVIGIAVLIFIVASLAKLA